jgi:hypothetical protein
MIAEKLEITIKLNELPQPNPVKNARQEFNFDCNDRITSITVKSNIWKKLTDAASNSPQRIAPMSKTSHQASALGNSVSKQNDGSCQRNPITSFRAKNKAGTNSALCTP